MLERSYLRVADERRLLVYHDKWLLGSCSFKIISPHVLLEEARVSDLLTSEGGWNIDLIKSVFLQDDADLIINMVISSTLRENILVWHNDSKGIYSVRFGYKLAKKLFDIDSSSSSSTKVTKI